MYSCYLCSVFVCIIWALQVEIIVSFFFSCHVPDAPAPLQRLIYLQQNAPDGSEEPGCGENLPRAPVAEPGLSLLAVEQLLCSETKQLGLRKWKRTGRVA